jgi:hypothetical protein
MDILWMMDGDPTMDHWIANGKKICRAGRPRRKAYKWRGGRKDLRVIVLIKCKMITNQQKLN